MDKQREIRILLVDDHEIVRQGLAVFIETVPQYVLVADVSDGLKAVESCRQYLPDVVLMDIVMPGMGGIEATRQIKLQCPDTIVIALTSYTDHEHVRKILRAGASGYILKNATADELIHAINQASIGNSVFSTTATQILVEMATQPTNNYALSERDREILSLMSKGMTNRQIGVELNLSRFTIKSYVSEILSKLQVVSRSEAVSVALQEKII